MAVKMTVENLDYNILISDQAVSQRASERADYAHHVVEVHFWMCRE